ncbi:GNAT family N-acetyltransferase [Maritalea sp.]|uniref:GNAT family N-acetyltransferase n=1 Tax=Maritalea sp. TaxID=2003361 RepID=UPI003EF95E0F
MNIPDLPPNITFPRLSSTRNDVNFAFDAKRAALGPHIVKRWGWDEDFQRGVHQHRFEEKPFFQILSNKRKLGTVSFEVRANYARFGEFYLFPEFQKQGIGSKVLKHCLRQADMRALPVKLEYLHWNPVGSLYRRHGFVETGQSKIHCFMEREVS